jgi:hypothetical protein
MINLGRNDKCFCGSGKKYKNCCLHLVEKREEPIKKTGIKLALLYPEEFDKYLESFLLLCNYRQKVLDQEIEAIYYLMELRYYNPLFQEIMPSYEAIFSIYCIYFGIESETLFEKFLKSTDYLSLPTEKKFPFINLQFLYPGIFKVEKTDGNYNFIDIIKPEIRYKNVFIKNDKYLIEQLNEYEFVLSCLIIGKEYSYLINEPFLFNVNEMEYKKLIETIKADYNSFLKEENLKDEFKNYFEYCWSTLVGKICSFLKIKDIDSFLKDRISYTKIYFEVLDYNMLLNDLNKNKNLRKIDDKLVSLYEYIKNNSTKFTLFLSEEEMNINFLFKEDFYLFLDEIYYPNKKFLKYINFELIST